MTVTRTVVDIAGYEPRLATDNRRRHVPLFVGMINRPFEIRHEPDRTDQDLVPFEAVVTMEVNFGLFRTLWVVVRNLNPGITRTERESADVTPAEFTERTW